MSQPDSPVLSPKQMPSRTPKSPFRSPMREDETSSIAVDSTHVDSTPTQPPTPTISPNTEQHNRAGLAPHTAIPSDRIQAFAAHTSLQRARLREEYLQRHYDEVKPSYAARTYVASANIPALGAETDLERIMRENDEAWLWMAMCEAADLNGEPRPPLPDSQVWIRAEIERWKWMEEEREKMSGGENWVE